jgi:hypothetical protein
LFSVFLFALRVSVVNQPAMRSALVHNKDVDARVKPGHDVFVFAELYRSGRNFSV